tara:strand:+ start:44 stop:880 length:837 start_codon:yes stop_codon:yes gene_type:complete
MSNIYIIKLQGAGDIVYKVSNLNNLNWSIDTPVSPMPLPEDSHEENILVKMEGNTAKIDLSWTINKGFYFGSFTGAGVGTFQPTSDPDKESPMQQITEFKSFVPKSIGDSYKIEIRSEDDSDVEFEELGTINSMQFTVSGDSPVVWNASMAFYVGTVVAMLEADIPNAPESVDLTASSGSLGFEYKQYDGYGTVPTGASEATAIKIKTKLGTAPWVTHANILLTSLGNPSTGVYTGTLALAAGEYRMKLAEINGYSADAAMEYYRIGATATSSTITVP